MRSSIAALCGFLALLGTARPVAAQTITSPFDYIQTRQSLGVFGGYNLSPKQDLDLGPHSGPIGGLTYTVQLSGPLAFEGTLGMIGSERVVFQNKPNPTNPAQPIITPVDTVGLALLLAEGGLRFRITGDRTWHRIAPYLAASAGVVANLRGRNETEAAIPADEESRFGPAFAVGAGIGTEWFATQRLSVRAEARDRLWRVRTPAGFSASGKETSNWTNNVALTLGAALHF
jgi:hypothetical protein